MSDRGLFSQIIEGRRDVSDTYLIQEDGIIPDLILTLDHIHRATDVVRSYLNDIPHYPNHSMDISDPGGPILFDMQDVAEQNPINREDLYAIDGTPATPHLRYSAVQIFAVAVMGMAYRGIDTPETILAKTSTNDLDTGACVESWDALVAWMKTKEEEDTNQSWPTTFREYEEREYAIKRQQPFTLIDGPLLPQNLITQAEGRSLLKRLLMQPIKLVGVVKSLQASVAIHRVIAQALNPGEALLIEPSRELIRRRDARHEQWVDKFFEELESDGCYIWRGVYRPATKAFGFECDIRHILPVISMLWSERDTDHLGHEIPFLLNQVDAHIRASYDASSFKNHLTYRLGLDLSEQELWDETHERELR